MTDMQVPVRPSTPAIDAYYAKYHGEQNPRYDFPSGKPIDNGLTALRGDEKQGIFDQSSVPQDQISAAEKYLAEMDAYASLHGGFYPGDSNDHTDTSAIGTAAVSSASTSASGSGAAVVTAPATSTNPDPAPLPTTLAAHGSEIQRLVAECKKDLSIADHYALDRLAAIGRALAHLV